MTVTYTDLISKIPSTLFDDLSSEYKVDKINHKLTGLLLFCAASQLSYYLWYNIGLQR